jgi:hypothetical protein
MNERQKQNKNSVQGPHQTEPPYIKKTDPTAKLNPRGQAKKARQLCDAANMALVAAFAAQPSTRKQL